MKAHNRVPLVEQRHEVRRALLAQRQVIAQRLGGAASDTTAGSSYPRSATMRLLARFDRLPGWMALTGAEACSPAPAGTRVSRWVWYLEDELAVLTTVPAGMLTT